MVNQVPASTAATQCRVITRDMTGKNVWDYTLLHESCSKETETYQHTGTSLRLFNTLSLINLPFVGRSFVGSFVVSFLRFSVSSFLPFFHSSFLPFFLSSFLPFFLSSFLRFFVSFFFFFFPFFLSSFLPFFHSSILPFFPFFLSSFLRLLCIYFVLYILHSVTAFFI